MVDRVREMKKLTQHRVNALHVYCRLVDWGVSRRRARRVCEAIEVMTRVFYR